jgi:hypothetical protein
LSWRCHRPAYRRANEHALLSLYVDSLKALGTEPPRWDRAWLAYRLGIAHGFFMWTVTQQVHLDMIEVLLRRLGTAAADLDTFELLGV